MKTKGKAKAKAKVTDQPLEVDEVVSSRFMLRRMSDGRIILREKGAKGKQMVNIQLYRLGERAKELSMLFMKLLDSNWSKEDVNKVKNQIICGEEVSINGIKYAL